MTWKRGGRWLWEKQTKRSLKQCCLLYFGVSKMIQNQKSIEGLNSYWPSWATWNKEVDGPLNGVQISVFFFPKAHLYRGSSVTCLFAFWSFSYLPLILTSWKQRQLSSPRHLSILLAGFLLFADLWDNRDNLGSSTSFSSLLCCCCQSPLSSLLSLHRQGRGYRSCQSYLTDLPRGLSHRWAKWFGFVSGAQRWKCCHSSAASVEAGNSLGCVFLLPNFDSNWARV